MLSETSGDFADVPEQPTRLPKPSGMRMVTHSLTVFIFFSSLVVRSTPTGPRKTNFAPLRLPAIAFSQAARACSDAAWLSIRPIALRTLSYEVSISCCRGAFVHHKTRTLMVFESGSVKSSASTSGLGSDKTPGTLLTVRTIRDFISSRSCTPFKFKSYSHRRLSSAVLMVTEWVISRHWESQFVGHRRS